MFEQAPPSAQRHVSNDKQQSMNFHPTLRLSHSVYHLTARSSSQCMPEKKLLIDISCAWRKCKGAIDSNARWARPQYLSMGIWVRRHKRHYTQNSTLEAPSHLRSSVCEPTPNDPVFIIIPGKFLALQSGNASASVAPQTNHQRLNLMTAWFTNAGLLIFVSLQQELPRIALETEFSLHHQRLKFFWCSLK